MDLLSLLRNRRSIRRFRATPIPAATLARILEAAQLSPSWKNKQCCQYLLLTDRAKIAAVGQLLRHNPSENAYASAPHWLVLCADPAQSGSRDGKDYYLCDAAISLQQAMLAAEAEGLGTCWVGVFPEDALKSLLGVPAHLRLVALTPIGLPDEAPAARPRRPLSELVHVDEWNNPWKGVEQ